MAFRDILGEGLEPLAIQLTRIVNQQRRANLYNQPSRRRNIVS